MSNTQPSKVAESPSSTSIESAINKVDASVRLPAQALVFSALTVSGAALVIATSIGNVDSFYPLVGFGTAVYIARRRFF